MRLRLIAACSALAMAGCATPTFSYIDGDRWFRAEMNTSSVIVLDVDGRSSLRNPVMVEPGTRVVRAQGPAAPGFRFGETRTLTLDVKPCTHYYLRAKRPNALSQDFTLEVDFEQPIAGCR